MARRRFVSTDISDDDGLAALVEVSGYFGALLYTWLIPHADDRGTFTANPKKLLAMVMPQLAILKGKSRVKAETIAGALAFMKDLGLIIEEGDNYYFPPRVFYRYQTYVPAPKRREITLCAENSADHYLITERGENSAFPSPSLSPSPSPSVVVERARDEVGEILSEFAAFGTVNEHTARYVEDDIDEYGIDWVRRSVRVAGTGKASGDYPPWSYVTQTLKRWRELGEPDDDKPRQQLQAPGRVTGRAGGDIYAAFEDRVHSPA